MLFELMSDIQQANKDLYFCSDKTNAGEEHHTKKLKSAMGEESCSQLFSIHADTKGHNSKMWVKEKSSLNSKG